MNINSVYNLSFGKTLLNQTMVRAKDGGAHNVTFVEYDPKDRDDIRRLNNIGLYWGGHSKQMEEHVRRLSSNFDRAGRDPESIPNTHFYGLEDNYENTIAIAQITQKKSGTEKYAEVDYIQTTPDEQYKSNRRRLKGLGETLMAQIVREVMKRGGETIELTSLDEKFWSESGYFLLESSPSDIQPKRSIHRKDFSDYINYVENKKRPKYNGLDFWG